MSLKNQLIARIRQDGPMTIAEYIAECLLHPTHGYYVSRDPLGAAGDFTTAPEISQMFGELIGLCLAQSWLEQGRPDGFELAELGPGRGTLMSDILRATKGVPGFHEAAQITLVEASPTLRDVQAKTLAGYAPQWIGTAAELPEAPLFLVANEFFDALPIRQFLRDGQGWCERLVGVQGETLSFGLGARMPQAALEHRLNDTNEGDLVEICPSAPLIIAQLTERIATHSGAALIVDYGDWRSLGDTFQAVRKHTRTNPLTEPGMADLTAHVDFEALAVAAKIAGCEYTRLTPQGVFLERLGITDRAKVLASGMPESAVENLTGAHRRLTHPDEMGNLFKVLGLYPLQFSPPPGLEP
ncbi:MAG: class I SAM-dependent methyltransferase [Ruegeria sp.]